MKRLYPLAAALALAACNSQPEVIDTRSPDPNAAAIANRPMAELPPAIRAQKSYRCADGSLAFVNWFVGDKQANVRLVDNGPATTVKSATGTSPWTSDDGWTLSGTDDKIELTQAGKKAQSCHT